MFGCVVQSYERTGAQQEDINAYPQLPILWRARHGSKNEKPDVQYCPIIIRRIALNLGAEKR